MRPLLALVFFLALPAAAQAQERDLQGPVLAPDGNQYWVERDGHMCRVQPNVTWTGAETVSYADLERFILDGWCHGHPGSALPKRLFDPDRNAYGNMDCRYFVATDRFVPVVNDGDFSDVTLWIVDEHRFRGATDGYRWSDKLTVARGLRSNPTHVRRPVDVTSEWFELLPRGHDRPLFSIYAFTRWKSYLLPEFKTTKLNPRLIDEWKPAKEVPGFKGHQDIAYRVSTGKSYRLHYRVLRVCSNDTETLFPEPALALPKRVSAKK